MQYVVVEWTGNDPKAVYHLTLPPPLGGGYVQISSMEGWKRRNRKRMPVVGRPASGRWFQIYIGERDYNQGLGKAEREAYEYDSLPQHKFDNVFAFYEAIQYDHRRDKYL